MELWILAFLLVVVQPIVGRWRFQRFVGKHAIVPTHRKLRFYGMVVVTQWTLTALCAWAVSRRQLNIAELGLLSPGPAWAWAIAAAFGAVLIFATLMAVRGLRKNPNEELPSHLANVARVLPLHPLERVGFTPVALTAGICEELLYRGFLTFVFLQLVHSMPAALAMSSLAFGFGHLYQGPRGVLSTTIFGLVLAALYLGAVSLWPGIALHAVVDLVNGNALGSLVRRPRPALTPAEPDAHTGVSTSEEVPPLERTTGT